MKIRNPKVIRGVAWQAAHLIRAWMGTVRLRSHGGVDQLRHFHHVKRFRRLILDLNPHILGRLIHAVLDHRPEWIRGLTVTDDDEAQVASPSIILTEYRGAGADARGERDGQQRYQPDETVHRCLRFLFLRVRMGGHRRPTRGGFGAADPDISGHGIIAQVASARYGCQALTNLPLPGGMALRQRA